MYDGWIVAALQPGRRRRTADPVADLRAGIGAADGAVLDARYASVPGSFKNVSTGRSAVARSTASRSRGSTPGPGRPARPMRTIRSARSSGTPAPTSWKPRASRSRSRAVRSATTGSSVIPLCARRSRKCSQPSRHTSTGGRRSVRPCTFASSPRCSLSSRCPRSRPVKVTARTRRPDPARQPPRTRRRPRPPRRRVRSDPATRSGRRRTRCRSRASNASCSCTSRRSRPPTCHSWSTSTVPVRTWPSRRSTADSTRLPTRTASSWPRPTASTPPSASGTSSARTTSRSPRRSSTNSSRTRVDTKRAHAVGISSGAMSASLARQASTGSPDSAWSPATSQPDVLRQR